MRQAYFDALKSTGSAVLFTAVTLAIGVSTWVFSALKFQVDMGILLTFMFIVNMLGAVFCVTCFGRLLLAEKSLIFITYGRPYALPSVSAEPHLYAQKLIKMALGPFSYLIRLNILSNLTFTSGTTSWKAGNKARKALE